jgi:hypothetical protein
MLIDQQRGNSFSVVLHRWSHAAVEYFEAADQDHEPIGIEFPLPPTRQSIITTGPGVSLVRNDERSGFD